MLDTLGIFLLVIAIAFFIGLIQLVRWRDRQWEKFADQHGGDHDPGGIFRKPSVNFTHAGHRVLIDESSGRDSGGHLNTRLIWPDRYLGLELFPSGILSTFLKKHGLDDIAIDVPVFEEQYRISGNDARAVRSFLAPDVRQAIEKLRLLWGRDDVYISVVDGEILVRKSGSCWTCKSLNELCDAVLDFYDSALATSPGDR